MKIIDDNDEYDNGNDDTLNIDQTRINAKVK